MNVYDNAHQLARSIKNSQEYKKYVDLEKKISQNEILKKKIDKFQTMQVKIQQSQINGQVIEEKFMKEAQELFDNITKNEEASEFFQAELKFNQMMADIFKIISDDIDLNK